MPKDFRSNSEGIKAPTTSARRNSIFSRSDGASSTPFKTSEKYLKPGIAYLKIDFDEDKDNNKNEDKDNNKNEDKDNNKKKYSVVSEKDVAKLKSDASYIHVFCLDDQVKHLSNLVDAFLVIADKYPKAKFFVTAALVDSEKIYNEARILLENDKFNVYFFDNSLGLAEEGKHLALPLSEKLKKNNEFDSVILFGNTSDNITAADMGVKAFLQGKTYDQVVQRKYPSTIEGQMLLHKDIKDKLGAPAPSPAPSPAPVSPRRRASSGETEVDKLPISNLKLK